MKNWIFFTLIFSSPAMATVSTMPSRDTDSLEEERVSTMPSSEEIQTEEIQTEKIPTKSTNLLSSQDTKSQTLKKHIIDNYKDRDPGTLYLIGYAYKNGMKFPHDLVSAREWFLLSANKGYGEAQVQMAIFNLNGWGGSLNYEAALNWLEKAIQGGQVRASRTYNVERSTDLLLQKSKSALTLQELKSRIEKKVSNNPVNNGLGRHHHNQFLNTRQKKNETNNPLKTSSARNGCQKSFSK